MILHTANVMAVMEYKNKISSKNNSYMQVLTRYILVTIFGVSKQDSPNIYKI